MTEATEAEEDSGGADVLTKHEKKRLRKLEREQERASKEVGRDRAASNKKIVIYSVVVVVVVVLGFALFKLLRSPAEESFTEEAVHWHARLKVFLCGEERLMPAPVGEHHLGLPLLHTHEDRLIHIEGRIWRKEDIMLGKYMDAVGVPFAQDRIFEHVNGNMCNDGKENKVRMFVNGEENFEFRDYVIRDNDETVVRYE